jgi:acetyl esterase
MRAATRATGGEAVKASAPHDQTSVEGGHSAAGGLARATVGLDPFFQTCLAGASGSAPLPEGFLDPANAWVPPESILIEDVSLPAGSSDVRCRLYSPATRNPRRALLWLHGGGFVDGSLDWAEAHAVAAELCERTDALVVSVDYRLVTDHVKYPAPLKDALDAWRWLRHKVASQGGVIPMYVGGASAGANLAAALALWMRDHAEEGPVGMLLAYGVFHKVLPTAPGAAEKLAILPEALRFTQEGHEKALLNYLGHDGPIPAYAAPGDSDLVGMPPAALIACEFDDLAASSWALAQQLESAGVESRLHHASGMLHGHFNWYPGPGLPETERSIAFLADWLLCDQNTTLDKTHQYDNNPTKESQS